VISILSNLLFQVLFKLLKELFKELFKFLNSLYISLFNYENLLLKSEIQKISLFSKKIETIYDTNKHKKNKCNPYSHLN